MDFNPNETATLDSGIFGLPYSEDEADLIILAAPWEVTTSYGSGTSLGPKLIYDSSKQMDLLDIEFGLLSEKKIFMEKMSQEDFESNLNIKQKAQKIVAKISNGEEVTETDINIQNEINTACEQFHEKIQWRAEKYLRKNKKVALVGGDHSSPLGLMRAIGKKQKKWSLLHIDAHLDLRDSYQGFKHSHASIIRNILQSENPPEQVVALGIRDFCPEEFNYYKSHPNYHVYFDRDVKKRLHMGETWYNICNEISAKIKNPLYISFDIDGLNPFYCPNTGTPVPGGVEYDQMITLLFLLREHKKNIIGFDLNEVSTGNPEWRDFLDSWDGNVGARILSRLCAII